MKTNIKNIRKSSNTKIIIVSDDKTILEKDIKEMDFSYAEGKYLGLDNRVNLATFSLEIAHFYRYVIEHKETFKNNR